jgi:hypothetical protein
MSKTLKELELAFDAKIKEKQDLISRLNQIEIELAELRGAHKQKMEDDGVTKIEESAGEPNIVKPA